MYIIILILGVLIGIGCYVHQRCREALGPNPIDNSVQLHRSGDTLPSPSPSPSSSSSPSPSPTSHPPCELVEPLSDSLVVVVLGWGGSTKKQLRRIIEFLTGELKCDVISYINPMLQYLYGSLDLTCVDQILEQLDSQLSNKVGPKGFVIFIHSNNGAFVYGELKAKIQDPHSRFYHLRNKLLGVVFDSAPAIFDATSNSSSSQGANPHMLQQLYHGFLAAFRFSFPSVAIVLKRPVYWHLFWTPAITLWAIGFKSIYLLMDWFNNQRTDKFREYDTRKVLRNRLRVDPPLVPHLFLYSSGDKLLSSKYVAHDFKKTGHVQHLLKERHIYVDKLRTFLEQV